MLHVLKKNLENFQWPAKYPQPIKYWSHDYMYCLYFITFILAIYRKSVSIWNWTTVLSLAYLFSATISLLQSSNPSVLQNSASFFYSNWPHSWPQWPLMQISLPGTRTKTGHSFTCKCEVGDGLKYTHKKMFKMHN